MFDQYSPSQHRPVQSSCTTWTKSISQAYQTKYPKNLAGGALYHPLLTVLTWRTTRQSVDRGPSTSPIILSYIGVHHLLTAYRVHTLLRHCSVTHNAHLPFFHGGTVQLVSGPSWEPPTQPPSDPSSILQPVLLPCHLSNAYPTPTPPPWSRFRSIMLSSTSQATANTYGVWCAAIMHNTYFHHLTFSHRLPLLCKPSGRTTCTPIWLVLHVELSVSQTTAHYRTTSTTTSDDGVNIVIMCSGCIGRQKLRLKTLTICLALSSFIPHALLLSW